MLHHFQGKIDIGTGNGGIISQLKMQNEMKLTDVQEFAAWVRRNYMPVGGGRLMT